MQRKISPKREKTRVQGDNGPSGKEARGGSVLMGVPGALGTQGVSNAGSVVGRQSMQSHDSVLTTCSSLLESPAFSSRKKGCRKNPKPAQRVERCGFHHRRGKASSPDGALSLRPTPDTRRPLPAHQALGLTHPTSLHQSLHAGAHGHTHTPSQLNKFHKTIPNLRLVCPGLGFSHLFYFTFSKMPMGLLN